MQDANGTSTSSNQMDLLSENYVCSEAQCALSVGLVLPGSTYADVPATSVRSLCEKVVITSNTRIAKEDKDKMLLRNESSIMKPELHGNSRTMECCWKAVIAVCEHRREAFKAATGKEIDDLVVENIESALCMIAHVNHVKFLPSSHYDAVVVGGKNAQKLARVIHAAFWPVQSHEEGLCRSQVVFGEKFKHIIYCPWEESIYDPASNFEEATSLILQTLKQLAKFNNAPIIMLPILRKCDESERSQKFNKWFKEQSLDKRLIGTKEVDSMQLIHYLQATPLDSKELKYVDFNGILTEDGVRKLVDYLKGADIKWIKCVTRDTIVKPLMKKEARDPHRDMEKVQSNQRSSSQPHPPTKRSKPQPLKEVNTVKKCYICGIPGHLAKECARHK